jgi:hypothetical protein
MLLGVTVAASVAWPDALGAAFAPATGAAMARVASTAVSAVTRLRMDNGEHLQLAGSEP